jgi:hypothetical protein
VGVCCIDDAARQATGRAKRRTDKAPTGSSMPQSGWILNDDQVAAVVTCIRNAWGNSAPAVSAGDMHKARQTLVERSDWHGVVHAESKPADAPSIGGPPKFRKRSCGRDLLVDGTTAPSIQTEFTLEGASPGLLAGAPLRPVDFRNWRPFA